MLHLYFLGIFALTLAITANGQQESGARKDGKCLNGDAAAVGDKVSVHYSGYIDESSASGVHGKMFDSSLKRKKPFDFKLGANQVIQGWEKG